MTVVNIGNGIGQLVHKPLPKKRHYANFIDAYINYTRHHEASKKFHRWTAISTLAGALGRHVYMDRVYYRIYPNLYILLVGPAGLVKKSTTSGIGMDLLRAIEGIRIMSDQVTQAALIDSLKGSYQKFPWPGTHEPHAQSALFIYASEFKVLVDEVFGSITELLTTFFDCTPADFTQAWTRQTKGEGLVQVFGPCLNLLGCSTSAWLRSCIPLDQLEGGFASRILYVVDNSLPEKFVAIPKRDPLAAGIRQKLIEDLTYIHNLTGEAHMTPAAELYFENWYHTLMQRIAVRGSADKFAGYWGRRSTMVEKLALILSINESDSLVVDVHHVKQAVTYLDELSDGMFDAFKSSGSNSLAEQGYAVYDLIRARAPIDQGALLRASWGDTDLTTLAKICDELRQMGAIRMRSVGGIGVYEAVDPARTLHDFLDVAQAADAARGKQKPHAPSDQAPQPSSAPDQPECALPTPPMPELPPQTTDQIPF